MACRPACFRPPHLIISAILSVCAITLYAAQPPSVSAGPRIVAIGDVHGALDSLTTILRTTGLIDAQGKWTGGSTHLVQTGDYTDRGPDVRGVLDLLMRLEEEARAAGGRADPLLGNHEAMNLVSEFRDVGTAMYAAFADGRSEDRRSRAYREYVDVMKRRGAAPADQETWNAAHPLGFVEYAESLGPRGQYGKWLRTRKAVHKDGDTLFMHAGVSDPSMGSLDEINRRVARDLEAWDRARELLTRQGLIRPFFTLGETLDAIVAELQRIATAVKAAQPAGDHVTQSFVEALQAAGQIGTSTLLNADGPLWFRGYAQWPEQDDTKLTALLTHFGVSRIVSGHTPSRAILPRFNARVFLIDTGMLVSTYKGRPSALEIANGTATAIYPDTREVLTAK
jgi:hypothetical protein